MIYFKMPCRMSKWKVEKKEVTKERRKPEPSSSWQELQLLRAPVRAGPNREHTMGSNALKVAVFPEKDVMSQVERMAEFVSGVRFEDLGPETRQQLKIRILDSFGCAIGTLGKWTHVHDSVLYR